MARSLSELISSRKKDKDEEEKKISSSPSSNTGIGNLIEKSNLSKTIGFDTFESDLADMGNTISGIYSGWQTPETMSNTLESVKSMKNRVDAYSTYQKKYMPDSTFDVDSLTSGYQKAIDDWDDLTKTYGYFKNAEAYNDFPNYLKSLEEANKKKEENKKKLDEAFLPYADYLEKDDYAEKSQYKNTATRGGFWKAIAFDGSDETYEYINDVDGARDKLIAKYKDGNDPVHLETHGYQFMTDNEKGVYNYIYATEGKKAAEKYLDALEISLNKRLYDKSTEEWEKMADDPLMAIAMTLATPITSMAGGIGSAIESAKEWATGGKYNPYASGRVAANATSDIRKYVGENIAESTEGMEVFGQNIPQFLYQTGMSIADSALGAYSLGKAFTPIMGMNAYQQTAKEMTEAGEDPETVQAMALASGVAETLFEYWSIEKLFKYKGVDSLKKGIKAALSQGVFEGFEEVSTELTNIIADDVFRGDGSDLQRQYNELIARGYSEEEAKEEVKKQFKTQLGWAFAGGALSGVAMGGAEAGNQYHNLTEMGANIRSNDRVSEMLDVASDKFMTANESDTYKLYTEYANKGVTADNISDVQLGNLYATSEMEAIDTLKSKKTTPQQKHDAGRRLEGLTRVSTAKTDEERAREARVKDLNTGEVTEVTSTGNSTKIEGIRMEDGKTILQTGEGEIAAEDMTFSQRDAELLAYAEGMGETKGSLLMAQYDGRANVESYVESFNLAYSYGETGFGSESVLRNKGVLSETQASAIYASAMTNKVREQQNAIDAINQKYSGNTEYHGTINDSAVNFENLTTSQRDAVNFVKAFAQVTGVNVEFFESDVVDGKRTGANGYYNKETNTIGIDVHAGINNINASDFKDAIIPTLSHEMTHWMKDKAPTLYNNMREIVMNTLTVDGLTSEARVAAEIQRMQKAHPDTKVTEDMAIDEIIARGCEDMLSNSQKAREMLSGLSENEQKSFIDKVKSTFQKLIDWANDLLSKYKSKSYEAQILRQYKDNLEELSKAWDQALTEAIQTNKALTAEGITGEQVIGENLFTETTAQLSMRTYENEGRELLHKWLENSDLDAETKTEIIEQMDHVYNVAAKYAEDNSLMDFGSWSETDIIRGADGSPLLSVVVPNGDYPLNIDFSQVCKKRKTLNAVLNALVRSGDLDFRSLSQSDINSINRIIKEHGFEIACALCFVDSKRYRVNDWADSFTDTYNKLVKSLVKGTNFVVDEFNYTGRPVKGVEGKLLKDADDSELNFDYINEVLAKNSSGKAIYRYALAIKNNKDLRSILRSSEIISSAGLDAIKVENRTLYDLVNSHQGSAKPKLAHGEVPYAYDILLQKKFNAEDAYKVGGVRMQSFSDYMANMFFDYVQMIGDLSAKQLPAHAYTKEYYFAKLFGLTGIKINLSVVPKGADITEDQKARFNKMTKAAKDKDPEFKKLKSHAGLDANGNYILEDETFPLDKALEIQNTEGYDKNCGIIWVGVSDKHIEKMLDDPNVPYIIPYHKSSLNPLIARMRNIDFYNDYTKAQNTRYDTKAKKKVPASIWSFDFYGDLAKTNDPRTTAENYKRECRERGYLPKFDDFASHPNYYKLLIDFRVYDNAGNYAPQGAVQMKFPDNFNEIVGESLREAQDTSARLDASMEGLLSDIRKELKIEKKQFSDRTATEEAKEFSDVNVQYSLREEAPPKTTAKAYKVFLLKNGQLYPPMVANPGGKGTPVGVWLNADAAPRAEDSKTGRPQVQAGGKGTNTGKMTLAYRPGWHLGDIPQATQFAKKNPETGIKELFPSNFVWAECEYATDVDYQEEAMSYGYNKNGKFQHSLAGLPKLPKDGYYRYRTNPNPDTVPWVITGAMKVNRILTDAETDAICRANGVEPLKRMGGPLTVEKLDAMGLAKLDYTQFSDRDSDGNVLTAEQMEYFKDSKVRDDDGNLKVMYHGSPFKFTVFEDKDPINGRVSGDGFYFTESKEEADYWGKKGKKYKVYLDIKNPFVVSTNESTPDSIMEVLKKSKGETYDKLSAEPKWWGNAYTRDEFIEDSVKDYTNTNTAFIWLDNKTEVLKSIGYDGVIVMNESKNPSKKGQKYLEVVAFESNQIKKTTNKKPTSDADIRYSDRYEDAWFDLFDSDGTFAESSAIIEEDVNRLKQRLSMGASIMSPENIKMIAKHLLKKADSRYDFEELTDDLNDIYGYIENDNYFEGNALIAKCNDVAQRILSEQKETKTTNDYAKMVMREIRNTRIKLNDEQIAEAKNRYGEKYRNALFGRITISNDGVSLDSKWADWATSYPDIFDANISHADQITELADIYDSLREASEVKQRFDSASDVKALGAEIYNQYWIRSTISAESEKNDKKIKELNFKHREAMKKLREDYQKRLADQKNNNTAKYKDIIKEIRQKKNEEVKEAKKLGKERMDKYKDRVARNAKIEQITQKALTLNKWMKGDPKKNSVPEIMKKPIIHLLDAIDFSSKQMLQKGKATKKDKSLAEAFAEVEKMALKIDATNARIEKSEVEDMYINLPSGLVYEIEQMSNTVNALTNVIGDSTYVLNDMSLEELEKFDMIITTLKNIITSANECHKFHYERGIKSLASNLIGYLEKFSDKKVSNLVSNFFEYDNATPLSVFKRLGEHGMVMFESFQDSWDTFAIHIKDIKDFTGGNKKKGIKAAYTEKEVKEWRRKTETFTVLDTKRSTKDDPKYKKVTMTHAQIMGLYLLNKREQAEGHIYGGGIRIADINLKGKANPITDAEGFTVKKSDVDSFISVLSVRQIEVADKLSEFMNTVCSDWGNEITMALYGVKSFTEKNYYPIKTDENSRAVKGHDDDTSIYRLLNMSFSKVLTPNANNKVVVDDIFSVFSSHCSDMAKYNAFALTVTDFLKVYSYNSKIYTGIKESEGSSIKKQRQYDLESMQTSIERAFGKGMKKYLRTFLEDINSSQSGGRGEEISKKMMSNYKIAAVGASLSVAALQPLSYARASMVIPVKYLLFRGNMLHWKRGSEKALKHSGIAIWKSLGFYDTDVAKGVQEQITHDESFKDKLTEASMTLAERGDRFTWGALWNACELEVKDRRKDLKYDSPEFNREVALKFREVIYATQVVDSTMTRTQMMRSKSALTQTLTAFMSEPSLTYNMVADTFFEWSIDSRRGYGTSVGKHGKKFAKAVGVYAVTALLSAAVRSGVDIIRDDDEEEENLDEYLAKLKENAISELNPLSKLPIFKDVVSIFEGYDPTRLDEQSLVSIKRAYDAWKKVIKDDKDIDYKTVYKTLQAVSQTTGLPVSNLTRDVVAMWNTSIGNAYPSLKIETK